MHTFTNTTHIVDVYRSNEDSDVKLKITFINNVLAKKPYKLFFGNGTVWDYRNKDDNSGLERVVIDLYGN